MTTRTNTCTPTKTARSGRLLAVLVAAGSFVALAACGSSGSTPPIDGNGGGSSSGGAGGSSGSGSGGGSGSSSGGSGGGSDAGTDAASPVPAFNTHGTMTDGHGNAVVGASICVLGAPSNCTTTDSSGSYAITQVPSSGAGLVGTAATFSPMVWPVTPQGNGYTWSGFFRATSLVNAYATTVGATDPGDGTGTTGAMYFQVYNASGGGFASVGITTDHGGTVGYLNASGSALDTTLTATSSDGDGYVFALPPGNVNVSVTGATGTTCTSSGNSDGPSSVAGAAVLVPIVAGSLTVVFIQCS
jgi:hypothetical protein